MTIINIITCIPFISCLILVHIMFKIPVNPAIWINIINKMQEIKSDLENCHRNDDKNVDRNVNRNDDTSKRGHEANSQLYILFAKYCESHGFYSITYILFIYLVRFWQLTVFNHSNMTTKITSNDPEWPLSFLTVNSRLHFFNSTMIWPPFYIIRLSHFAIYFRYWVEYCQIRIGEKWRRS